MGISVKKSRLGGVECDWVKMNQYQIFLFLALPAMVLALAIAVYTLQRRFARGALHLSFLMFATLGWLIFNTLELVTSSDEQTLFWAKQTYLLIVSMPVLWFSFAIIYTIDENRLPLLRQILLWIIPASTYIFVLLNDHLHLIWIRYSFIQIDPGLTTMRVEQYGLWFWVQVVYAYTLVFIGAVLLAFAYFRSFRLYRAQSMWLIIGAITPLAVNIVYIFHLIPDLKKDFSPIAFAFAGAALAYNMFRYRLFDIMPIAHSILINNMREGVIALDTKNRIVDINPVAIQFFNTDIKEMIGQYAEDCLVENNELLKIIRSPVQFTELTIKDENESRHFEARLTPLMTQNDKLIGRLIMLHEITEVHNLLEEVKQTAARDPLTEIGNRRHIMIQAQQEITRSARYGHPLSFLIVDIDHFKKINDTHGHIVGDQILQLFARYLQESLRSIDTIGRYGGDEFIALLPETLVEAADELAKRLCNNVRKKVFLTTAGEIRLTISIGVRGLPKVDKTVDFYTLLDQADQALYKAKTQGRDQVIVWDRQEE